ncbi:MAG: hypothetical protein MUC78_10680, partial [Bacteroidales bacterium]|nr:hypothetical protein [Bacteroidales bacterium]
MKKASLLTACMMLMTFGNMMCQEQRSVATKNEANSVSITAASEIESLVGLWVEGFEGANPGMKVKLISPEVGTRNADIHFVAGSSLQESGYSSAFSIVVGRDVVVPVMSENNPFIDEIFKRGISPKEFASLLSSEENYTWGQIMGNQAIGRVNALILGNSTVHSSIARFVSLDPSLIGGSVISTPAALPPP